MDLNCKLTVPIKFHSMEHDVFMIQSLQQLYSDHYYEKDMGEFYTAEDEIACEERLRAAEVLLKYYMFPKDYKKFFESVKNKETYVFDFRKYQD